MKEVDFQQVFNDMEISNTDFNTFFTMELIL